MTVPLWGHLDALTPARISHRAKQCWTLYTDDVFEYMHPWRREDTMVGQAGMSYLSLLINKMLDE